MSRIAVIGSCNVDLTVEADRRPGAGETVMGRRLIISPGGKGANQAVAAARVGADVWMIGCVGDDANGQMMMDTLKKEGIHTDYVKVIPGVTTGTAHITLAEGDNSIIVVKGANDCVDEACIDEAWDVIKSCDMVLLQHEIPLETNAYVIRRAAEEGVSVMLNPAPFAEVPQELIEKTAYVTPNEHEAALMFPGKTKDEILRSAGCRVIMTVGKDGVAFGEGGKTVTVPGFTVPVVDTTGAGDTFNGAFAAAKSEGMSLREAVRFANAAAALSIGKIGAQGGMPRRSEVEEMLVCRK